MAVALFHCYPHDRLGSNGCRAGKHDWHQARIAIKQHATCKAGDVGGQEEVHHVAPAGVFLVAQKARLAAVDVALHQFKPYLANVSGEDADEGLNPRLLKTKDGVAQNIEHGDGNSKSTQSTQTVRRGCFSVRGHAFLLADEASMMVCRPGLRFRVSRWIVPFPSRHARSTVRVAGGNWPRPKCNSGLRFPECPLLISTCWIMRRPSGK